MSNDPEVVSLDPEHPPCAAGKDDPIVAAWVETVELEP
jgi:hypothetical protein